MAISKHSVRSNVVGPGHSFDVVRRQVIGTVKVGEDGRHSPIEAAFLLIARQPEEGVYEFQTSDHSSTIVTIGYREEVQPAQPSVAVDAA